MTRTLLALPFAVLALACVEPDPATLGATEQEAGCNMWGCGTNSPILGPFNMYELNENGPNLDGITITDLILNGQSYRVDVQGARLVAIPLSGTGTLSGTRLIGARIRLSTSAGPAVIHIENVTPRGQLFWRGPVGYVETYELKYTGAGMPNFGGPIPLCLTAPSTASGEGPQWAQPYEAILYTGDRYNSIAKTVTASSYAASGNYFNIACAGGALAKLHLNRYTTASSVSGYTSTAATRQAMLKMYTGDVCGSGVAYTMQGTSLKWTNAAGQSSSGGGTTSNEAMWTAAGASCIQTHRLHNTPNSMDNLITCAPWNGGALPYCAGLPLSQIPADLAFLTQSAAIP